MFRKLAMAGVVVCWLGTAAVSQQFFDPFNYPSSTTIPGYTEQVGDWKAVGGAVECQAGISSQTLIRNGITDLDCCVETLAIYNMSVPGLQRTGPVARFSGSGSSASYFYLKVQDNAAPRDGWDTYWLYHQGTSGSAIINGSISPPAKAARARMQLVDEPGLVRIHVFIDTDLDGRWDITQTATTTRGLGIAGGIGINGARSAQADNLEFYNATLYLPGAPRIGTPVGLKGRGGLNLVYIGACSFGNLGVPIGANRKIPLDVDTLFGASQTLPQIFQNFVGLTDVKTGDFTLTVVVPPVPALVGGTIYASAVTADRTGILEIAPDVEITFVK